MLTMTSSELSRMLRWGEAGSEKKWRGRKSSKEQVDEDRKRGERKEEDSESE